MKSFAYLLVLPLTGSHARGASLISTTTVNVGPWFNCITESTDIDQYGPLYFNLFPNPASDLLNISGYEFFDEYIICDITGKVCKSETRLTNPIVISTLANGYYFLILKSKGNFFQRKFIKNSIY